jgi:hypothetical protein
LKALRAGGETAAPIGNTSVQSPTRGNRRIIVLKWNKETALEAW